MSSLFTKFQSYLLKNNKLIEISRLFVVILPGAIFLALGLCLLFAPQFLAFFFCAFLLILGGTAIWIGYKINQIRIKFRQLSAQVEAKLFIDPQSLYNMNSGLKSSHYSSKSDLEVSKTIKKSDLNAKDAVDPKTDIVIQLSDGKKVICH